jgi:hypothetical protein
MSLNYSMTDIENYEQNFPPVMKDGEEHMNPVTHTIIMTTIGVGLGWKLTKKNIDLFTERMMQYQAIIGPLMQARKEDGTVYGVHISPKHIRDHLGLEVNSEVDTKAEWKKKLLRWIESEGQYLAAKLEREDAEEQAA